MEKITINGQQYSIVCNIYSLVQFAKRIGEKSITAAMSKMAAVGDDGGASVEGLETWAALVYELLLAGAKKEGVELNITLDDCFDTAVDTELAQKVIKVVQDAMPATETMREAGKGEKAA